MQKPYWKKWISNGKSFLKRKKKYIERYRNEREKLPSFIQKKESKREVEEDEEPEC